jgi:hypothetical protein
MARVEWVELPVAVRRAVAAEAGGVLAVAPVSAGFTCSFAARVDTPAGSLFVKGAPDAAGRAGQRWEVAVAPLVAAAAPALRWRVDVEGWELLAFDWVAGQHADLSPGSPDLALVADALAAVQGVAAPPSVPQLADRLDGFLAAGERELLTGSSLLHTDTNPHNLLAGDGRAWLVDWAMPAAGPAWVDVAYTAVRLLEEGASAEQALGWAARFPSWRAADPKAVEVFVSATCRQWEARVGVPGCRSSNERFAALAA